MDSMIERVAKALVSRRANDESAFSDSQQRALIELQWPIFLDDARTAIAAMREPTQKMLAAGFHDDESNRDFWLSMIDAALAEDTNGKA